jgi:threonine dehydrogenase-like Zn-dependent dehydrogenase
MSIKAVVLTGPGHLELREFPEPKLEPGTMLVRMAAAGICGTDRHAFDGHMPTLAVPVIPGHENLGVIEEIAGEFKDADGRPLAAGDRIVFAPRFSTCGECYYCKWLPSNYGIAFCVRPRSYGFVNCEIPPFLYGGWAEKIVLQPGTWCYRVPEQLTNEEAVLADVLASVCGVERAVFHCSWINMGLGLGQTAVIQGAGGVGLLAAVKAQLLGATRTIMVGGPAHRLRLAREFGVDDTIDIAEVPAAADRVAAVKELTGGIGADLVVECAGVPAAVPEGLDMLRKGGVYVEIGNFTNTGTTVINPWSQLCAKDVTLIGQYAYTAHQYRKDFALLVKHRERFPFHKMVTHRFALSEFDQAMKTVRQEDCLKAIFAP